MIFSRNTALNGGAIYMSGASFLNYTSPLTTRVSFLYNTAYLFGGAIYVDQPYYSNDGTYLYCFYQFIAPQSTLAHFRPPPVEYNRLTAVAYVEGNKAGEAGSVLYGGDGYCSQDRSGLETSVDNYIKADRARPQVLNRIGSAVRLPMQRYRSKCQLVHRYRDS